MAREHQNGGTPLSGSAIHLLHRAEQCAGDIFADEVSGEDLTPRQFAILLAVSKEEGLSQTDLVTRTGIDRSTLADIVRRLVKKGLLSRRRTRTDARAYAVRLSERGREVVEAAEPSAAKAEARLLAPLDQSQREAFLMLLDRIVRNGTVQA